MTLKRENRNIDETCSWLRLRNHATPKIFRSFEQDLAYKMSNAGISRDIASIVINWEKVHYIERALRSNRESSNY